MSETANEPKQPEMHFTAEQLDEALKFVNEKYTIEGGHFEIAREKYHEETLKCFREAYFADEPLCVSLELEWDIEAENFMMSMIKENLSLVAVNDTTGEVMGIRITAPINKDEKMDAAMFKNEKIRKIFTLVGFADEQSDFYNRYGVTEGIEFFALAVYRQYRQCGLGTKLMTAAVELLRHCKPDNAYIKSAATSNYSAKIFNKLGFEKTCEIQYKDYIVDGEVVFNNTGDHYRFVGYALKI